MVKHPQCNTAPLHLRRAALSLNSRARFFIIMSTVTLGLIQGTTFASQAESLARHDVLIRDAAAKGAQIICLQELFNIPYFCTRQDTALFDHGNSVTSAYHLLRIGFSNEFCD